MDYRSVAAFDARQRQTGARPVNGPAGLKRMVVALMLVAAMVVLLDHGSSHTYATTQRADASIDGRIAR